MQTTPSFRSFQNLNRLTAAFTASAAMLLIAAASPLQAAVPVSFSGGSGTPLTMTLSQDITFLMDGGSVGPYFIVQGAPIFGVTYNISGSMEYTLPDDETAYGLTYMGGRGVSGDVTADDLAFTGNVAVTDAGLVTLLAGSWTTQFDVSFAAPVGFSFNMFLVDTENNRISADAVPEPSTYALLGLGALILGYSASHRRKIA